jgi:hypothetical protein
MAAVAVMAVATVVVTAAVVAGSRLRSPAFLSEWGFTSNSRKMG